MKAFLFKLLIFLGCSFAINSIFALAVQDRIKLNRASKYHWTMSKFDNEYDLLFVGSSRVEMTVDPVLIDRRLNTRSINVGASGGGVEDQYLLARHIIESNHVDVVLYQLDYLTLAEKFTHPFQDYVWLCYDDDRGVRDTLIDTCGPVRYWTWKAIPFLRLMEFSSLYRLNLLRTPSSHSFFDDTRGGQTRDEPSDASKKDQFASYAPRQRPLRYVQKTIDLCRQNGVRLIIFQAPYPSTIASVSEFERCDRAIEQLVDEQKLEYWNFSDAYQEQHDLFYDHHHLNSRGARVFSERLAERLAGRKTLSE